MGRDQCVIRGRVSTGFEGLRPFVLRGAGRGRVKCAATGGAFTSKFVSCANMAALLYHRHTHTYTDD